MHYATPRCIIYTERADDEKSSARLSLSEPKYVNSARKQSRTLGTMSDPSNREQLSANSRLPVYTQGEVTSQSLRSRYDRHFVGITKHNALR